MLAKWKRFSRDMSRARDSVSVTTCLFSHPRYLRSGCTASFVIRFKHALQLFAGSGPSVPTQLPSPLPTTPWWNLAMCRRAPGAVIYDLLNSNAHLRARTNDAGNTIMPTMTNGKPLIPRRRMSSHQGVSGYDVSCSILLHEGSVLLESNEVAARLYSAPYGLLSGHKHHTSLQVERLTRHV